LVVAGVADPGSGLSHLELWVWRASSSAGLSLKDQA